MKTGWIAGLFLLIVPRAAMAQPTDQHSQDPLHTLTPELARYTDHVLTGDIWKRPDISPRDRSLVTIAILIASGNGQQLEREVQRGLDNGLHPTDLTATVTHLAFYCGWPNALSALDVVQHVFAERHIHVEIPGSGSKPLLPVPASDGAKEKLVNDHVGPTDPKLATLTNDVLFGDLWRHPDLAPRDRSLITIAALAADGDDDQLGFHIQRGIENGLTRAQIAETLTQLAFYRGWPKALAAVTATQKALAAPSPDTQTDAPPIRVYRLASKATLAPAVNFTGHAALNTPFQGTGGASLLGATVSFQPGTRTRWHTHPHGQMLVVMSGHGWVQTEGGPVYDMLPGDVVVIAPNVRHWHGATSTSSMSHVAIAAADDKRQSVYWLEYVTDTQYHGPQR